MYIYIVYIPKVLDLTHKSQLHLHAEITHASIATMSLHVFICVRVRLQLCAFASTVGDGPRAYTCVHAHIHACVRIYVHARCELHLKSIK